MKKARQRQTASKFEIPEIKSEIEKPPSKLHHLLYISLILIISIAIYSNTLKNGFVYDDRFTIVENIFIKDWKNLPELFSKTYFSRSGEETYRPIVTLTYFLDYSLWGLKPFGYHLTNILLHSANVVLVYLFALSLFPLNKGGQGVVRWIAFLTALLFSIHPIQAEAVNAISFREDLLAVFFLLPSFILYIKLKAQRLKFKAFSFQLSAISYVLYLLALLSKEMAVTFPLLLTGYHLCFTQDKNLISHRGTEAQRTTTPFFNHISGYVVVTLIYLFLYLVPFSNPKPEIRLHPDFLTRLLTLPKIIVQYLWLIIAPYELNAEHIVRFSKSLIEPSTLFSILILIGLGIGVSLLAKNYKRDVFGMWWFFVSLLPVINIIPIGNIMAERYLYLPFVGISLFLSIWLIYLYGVTINLFSLQLWKRGLIAITTVSVLLLGILTHLRNMDWKDDFALWSKTVIASPESPRAHNNLGNVYEKQGRLNEAMQEYKKALRLNPNHEVAHNNLGFVYAKQGRLDEAIKEYNLSLSLKPNYAKVHNNIGDVYYKQGHLNEAINEFLVAIKLNPDLSIAHYNLGNAYEKQGQHDKAIKEYKLALTYKPDYTEVHYNLGNVYLDQGHLNEAIEEFQIALKLNPDYVKAHYNLGYAYGKQGRLNEAIEEFQIALRLNPDYVEAHNNLGYAYGKQGHLNEAIEEFQIALRLNPDYVEAHYNLGNIYHKQGRLDDAVKEYRTAIRLKPEFAMSYRNLGLTYIKQHRLDEAINELLNALKFAPNDEIAHYNMALAYNLKGLNEKAIEELEFALRLKPDYLPARQALESMRRR